MATEYCVSANLRFDHLRKENGKDMCTSFCRDTFNNKECVQKNRPRMYVSSEQPLQVKLRDVRETQVQMLTWPA